MDITSLTYERLVNLGQYENVRIAAVAQPGPGEDPALAFAALREFVDREVAIATVGLHYTNGARSSTAGQDLECAECGDRLLPQALRRGPTWTPRQLAYYGLVLADRVLCFRHFALIAGEGA